MRLRGAREHNLRNLDLSLPCGQWIAVTGPSGSGKTSLVFDTLVRESQRRYLGSLSARARQFLGKLGRADLDSLSGLPATIAVGATTHTRNPRSTVGTLSGILSPLRILFARTAVDPSGGSLSLSQFSFNHPDGACGACGGLGVEDRVDPNLLVADPRKSIRSGALRPTLASGYTVYSQVTLEVMDRICRAHGFDLETPWRDLSDAQRDVILYGTRALKVPFGKHSIESRMRWEGITARPREEGKPSGLSAGQFSPNRTEGACPACEGRGRVERCSPERLVTHPDRSLLDGALQGTQPGRFFSEPDGQFMATLAAAVGPAVLTSPWADLPDGAVHAALFGTGEQVFEVSWRYKRGKRSGEHRFEGTWDGLCALVEREARVRAKRKSAAAWAEPLADVPCAECAGARLAPAARAVLLLERSLPELLSLPLLEVRGALSGEAPGGGAVAAVLDALLPEILARTDDLCASGLGHLSLDRPSRSLSDGELQRIRLTSVLRSGLTGLTLVLDEPGAGLHARDVGTLLARLQALRDAGHTVVVVSHRPQVLRAADHLIELGPEAGPGGGRIVASGPPATVLAGDTATAVALRTPPTPPASSVPIADRITIRGANAHTLGDLDLSLPAAGFVAVTGVSGSGKSSLVFDVLGASAKAGAPRGCVHVEGLERFTQVRSSRATERAAGSPLEALGLLPDLQALFFARAKESGLGKAAFSFHSSKGRCPTCKGTGRERVALEVLADLQLPCPTCAGARFRGDVLAIRWQGLSIAEFLERPASELASRLPSGRLRRGAEALVRVGLGHLSLGRRCAELSGGELPRVSLAATLAQAASPSLLLLDEPARGLHERDLASLATVLRELAARGDLVVAAVHRLSLIRAADEVIDLGPGSGPEGGRLVDQGAPGSLTRGATADALSRGAIEVDESQRSSA